MFISEIKLKNFRNIDDLTLTADKGINIIFGENAQGKTNILEALWLFTGAKSFRNAKDAQMIGFKKEKADLKLKFFSNLRNQSAEIVLEEKRQIFLNEVELKSNGELVGNINAIIFSPNDLSIINEGPSVRRKTVDLGIGQIYPLYIEKLRKYNHICEQRNALLKTLKYDDSMYYCLEDFDRELILNGTEIIAQREKYIEKLNKYLPKIFCGLSDKKENITAEYMTNGFKDKEEYKTALKNAEKEDLKNFSTSVGPHRDEIEIKINGKEAKIYGSQGQRRSAALALKLAQAAIIKEETGEQPIALLDDVLSELDEKRQNYVLNHIKDWQVFITCCDPSNIERLTKGKIFNIEKGNLKEL